MDEKHVFIALYTLKMMLECLLVDLHSMHDGLEEIDPEISPRNSLGCGSVD